MIPSLIAAVLISSPLHLVESFIDRACALPWVKCASDVSTKDMVEDVMDSFIYLLSRSQRSSFTELGGTVEVTP